MKLKQNILFFVVLAIILLACGMLWMWTNYPVTHIPSDNGTRDLRASDFDSEGYDLFGPVEYIPNELLTPEEFEERQNEIRTGNPEETAPYSTSRLRIYVPEGTYGLILWNAEYASNVYINGEFVESIGKPAGSEELMVPGVRFLFYTVTARDGVIEILQQASSFVIPEGDSHSNIIIGNPKTAREIYNKHKMIPTIMMGCFLVLLLTHLALFFIYRTYKANLWFALFCLVGFIRSGYTSPWIMFSVLPLPVLAAFRLSMLTLPAATLLVCLTLNIFLKGILAKWFRIAMYSACGLYAVVCLFANTGFVITVTPFFYIAIVLIAVYILIKSLMNLPNYNIEQYVVLAGACLFILAAMWDIIPDLLQVSPDVSPFAKNTAAEIALLVFIFFQMTVMLFSTIREVAEAKEAEQQLLSKNALLEKETKVREEMVRNLSHEVRTPLTVIGTYAQLAMRQWKQGEPEEQIMEGLSVINEEAQRISALASGTLADKEPEIRPVDVGEVAQQLVRLFLPMAEHASRKISVNISDKLLVSCSAGEITQVIWNLLDNAMKHGGGNIDVDGNINNENVYIIVTDYGAGISAEILPKILDRGVSGSGGSGLGLAISHEIAIKYGGDLIMESEQGMGTAATLLLPVYSEKRTTNEK